MPIRFPLVVCTILLAFLYACEKETTAAVPEPDVPFVSSSTKVIHDTVQGVPIVLAGNDSYNFIVSYEAELDGQLLSFQSVPSNKSLPVVMQDAEGNEWDIFGKAVSGPRRGQQLTPTSSTMGYWFVFSNFYESVDIYERSTVNSHNLPRSDRSDWLIPFGNILDGGVGFDGIPALVNPEFASYNVRTDPENKFYLTDDDLVVGINFKDQLKLYPHPILDWHEIINDDIKEQAFALVYCPLTGTTTVWDRNFNGSKVEFGVSGYLHNSNIIPFDRETQSFWSQLYGLSVNGDHIGERVVNLSHVETTWRTWKIINSSPEVVTENTGYSRNYRKYPYGDYRENNDLLFPIAYEDNRLPIKERVHAIVSDDYAKVYRFKDFE